MLNPSARGWGTATAAAAPRAVTGVRLGAWRAAAPRSPSPLGRGARGPAVGGAMPEVDHEQEAIDELRAAFTIFDREG
jgi:hypothetical protein